MNKEDLNKLEGKILKISRKNRFNSELDFVEGKFYGFDGKRFEVGKSVNSTNIVNLAGWDSGVYSVHILESDKVLYENPSVLQEYVLGKEREDEDLERIRNQGVWYLENL
jgi:hypothetical protein